MCVKTPIDGNLKIIKIENSRKIMRNKSLIGRWTVRTLCLKKAKQIRTDFGTVGQKKIK